MNGQRGGGGSAIHPELIEKGKGGVAHPPRLDLYFHHITVTYRCAIIGFAMDNGEMNFPFGEDSREGDATIGHHRLIGVVGMAQQMAKEEDTRGVGIV